MRNFTGSTQSHTPESDQNWNDIPQTASTTTVDMVNDVDVSHLPAKDAYAYALTLLDVFYKRRIRWITGISIIQKSQN